MTGLRPFFNVLIFVLVVGATLFIDAMFSENAWAETDVVLILDPGHGGNDRGGWDGRGFKFNGARIPEDAYTYDVAKRIEKIAAGKNWTVFPTVTDAESGTIAENREEKILPPRRKAVYNFADKKTTAFSGKDGLRKRLEAAQKAADGNSGAVKIFISLHFDHANSLLCGAQIFTAQGMARHPFVKTLADEFEKAGLGLKFGPLARAMANQHNELILLTEGTMLPRVLVEMGNFNCERDRKLMLSKEGREKYAEIITGAAEKFLQAEKSKKSPAR